MFSSHSTKVNNSDQKFICPVQVQSFLVLLDVPNDIF